MYYKRISGQSLILKTAPSQITPYTLEGRDYLVNGKRMVEDQHAIITRYMIDHQDKETHAT